MKIVSLDKAPEPNAELVEQLEQMLEEARKGEIQSLFTVMTWRKDMVSSSECYGGGNLLAALGELTWLQGRLVRAIDDIYEEADGS